MRKIDELTNPKSCMSRANDSEMTFVLLGRDLCAPDVIRYWARLRVTSGKNKENDTQILEALECARTMEYERLAKVQPMTRNERPAPRKGGRK